MRAEQVLQKCLGVALESMHALRQRVLLRAVDALLTGRRLTLMDMARSWPGAERVRAPLKALDRLLSNRHLHGEREQVYAAMAGWLLRAPQPIIVVDWSDLKDDKSWHLLRAAVPVGGRTMPVLDMVFPGGEQGSPKAEQRFLQRLQRIVPEGVCPILITDAGFRAPWLTGCAVERRFVAYRQWDGTGWDGCGIARWSSRSTCPMSQSNGRRAGRCMGWPVRRHATWA